VAGFNYKNQRYAVGLLSLSPLGDLIRRRQLLLVLMFTSGSLSVGLALTKSILSFEILSFFVAISSVTPQVCIAGRSTYAQRKLIGSKVLIPLTADLARPNRRATSIAIVLSGLLMGVLLARVLGGVIAQFSSFRNIYWMGVGGKNSCKKSK
jgi:MFS family permease